ncbi:hypothetical protein Tco_0397894 [Tanacetum coccineum]
MLGIKNEYLAGSKNVGNQVVQDAVQNQGVQNIGNGNVVAARAEGNATGNNDSVVDCSREKQIQTPAERQASSSGTQSDKAPVYDSDGSAEVHNYDNCYDNEIFNMFTQEEQYTEILEPIPEPHQVQTELACYFEYLECGARRGTVDQHYCKDEEKTRAYFANHLYKNWPLKLESSAEKHQCLYDGKVLLEKHDPPVVMIRKEDTAACSREDYKILNSILKEAAKFVRDFKSLAKEADESLAKHKALELEIERLLRAVVSQRHYVFCANPRLINPLKPSREEKYVPNKVRASVRTTPITVSQPHVVTKKDVNSDSNGLSSTGVDKCLRPRKATA